MNSVRSRGDTKKCGHGIERHAIYARWDGAASELIKLVTIRYGEYPDNSTFVRSGSQKSTFAVQSDARQRRSMSLDNVDGF